MADVFISYSRKDYAWAENLTQILERSGIACWTAPRNLTNAYSYEEQIQNAVAECKLLIFLASRNSVEAKGCQGELEFAYNLKKIILPIYLEPVRMSADLEYYLRLFHSIYLYRDYDRDYAKGLDRARDFVRNSLEIAEDEEYSTEIIEENKNSATEDIIPRHEEDNPRVFISHDSDDASRVAKYVKLLEGNDIPCWIAPRDIPYGSNYAREIPTAIEKCRCCIVFVSKKSQSSAEIEKEIEIANKFGKIIIPAKLDNCDFSGPYMYHLTNKQWFNAYEGSQEDQAKLIRNLKAQGCISEESGKNDHVPGKQKDNRNTSEMKKKMQRIKKGYRSQEPAVQFVLLLLAICIFSLLTIIVAFLLFPVLEKAFGEFFSIIVLVTLFLWFIITFISA